MAFCVHHIHKIGEGLNGINFQFQSQFVCGFTKKDIKHIEDDFVLSPGWVKPQRGT